MKHSMQRWWECLALGMIIILGGAAAAQAKDFCIQLQLSSSGADVGTYVGKSFAIPRAGKCKRWTGFPTYGNNGGSTGTVCTRSNGSAAVFSLTSFIDFGVLADTIVLPLPSLTGGGGFEINLRDNTIHLVAATGSTCTVPFP